MNHCIHTLWITFALILITQTSSATELPEDTILTLHPPITQPQITWNFPNTEKTTPKISNFALKNHLLMSNKQGERWAIITVQNQASGT